MDLSKYTFRVGECASLLDEIEPRLGVKFDRKALFDHEQSLVNQSRSGLRIMDVRWTFKFSKTGSYVHFFTSKEAKEGEVKECGCGNHVQITSRSLGYGTNALECALDDLGGGIPKIQALRQPQQGQQMTPQDKETIMHETIARASLVAFAEFIGQPISDLDAVFRQARGLAGGGSMAIVGSIPIDGTKPICVQVIDGRGIGDGVRVDGSSVMASFWLFKSEVMARSLAGCVSGFSRYALDVAGILATERAKLTPPPPNPEPIPCEAECRAHVKTLNAQLGINLNEDAVLAAGEAVRVNAPAPPCSYILTIVKSTRAASFSVVPGRNVDLSGFGKGTLVIVRDMFSNFSGLECALASMVKRGIPEAIAQLTPSAPTKPALTEGDLRAPAKTLETLLGMGRQQAIFVFNGKETYNNKDDAAGFFGLLSSGATLLSLTFQSRSKRKQTHGAPRVHVHTSPAVFSAEFNTTISAPIDPANPAATLTALADRIRNENL